MLKIRLQRVGRVNEPVFRVVLTDSKNSTKSGKYLEVLGAHDPREKNKVNNHLDLERIKYWMSKGAQVSERLHNMLVDAKVVGGKKINVLPKKKPIVKEEAKVEAKPAVKVAPAEAPATPVEAPATTA